MNRLYNIYNKKILKMINKDKDKIIKYDILVVLKHHLAAKFKTTYIPKLHSWYYFLLVNK